MREVNGGYGKKVHKNKVHKNVSNGEFQVA